MTPSVLCDNHAKYPAALFCSACSAILCKMCVDVEPEGYVCSTCKSPCRKCSAGELQNLAAGRTASPAKQIPARSVKPSYGEARTSRERAAVLPTVDDDDGTELLFKDAILNGSHRPLTRAIGLARLVMIVFGAGILFFGLVYLSMINRDAQNAQYYRESTRETTVKALNAELKAAKSESARDKINLAIAEAESAAVQPDLNAEAMFSKGRLDAGFFIFTGLTLLASFFASSANSRGAMFAALAATLLLLPDIITMMTYKITTTSTLIRTQNFDIVRERTTYLGMIVAIPLLVAIYVLFIGFQASLTMHQSRQVGQ